MNTSIKKDCLRLMILLLCFLIGASSLSAQILYTDIVPDEKIHNYTSDWGCSGDQYPLDVDGDGETDFFLNAECTISGGYTHFVFISIESSGPFNYFLADEYVDTLNYYDVIKDSLNWISGESSLLKRNWYPLIYYGNWQLNKEYFIGLKFSALTGTCFGWIRMEVTDETQEAIIKDYAFNSQPLQLLYAGEGLWNFAQNVVVSDVGDLKNGSDLKVNFDPAYDETAILEYRIMVVNTEQAAFFTVDSANAVTEDNYSSVPANGAPHSLQLDSTATSTNSQAITNMIGYSIFILSFYEDESENVLSFPVPIMLRTQPDAATQVFGTDNGNYGDGRDVQVSFNKIGDENKISEYRVMLVPKEQADNFTLEMANLVGQGNYAAVIPSGSNVMIELNEQSTDILGDAIIEEKGYYIFVLSVADGLLTDKNALSASSNLLILSTPSYLYAGQHDQPYINYTDIEPDTIVYAYEGEGTPPYYVDLNGDGTDDYKFGCSAGGSLGYNYQTSVIIGLDQNSNIKSEGYDKWILKFDFGTPLTFTGNKESGTCLLSEHVYDEMTGETTSGYWYEATDKYAGLILFNGNDTIMGWVRLSVPDYSKVIIKEYAWMFFGHQTIAAFVYEKEGYEVHFTNFSHGFDSLLWDFGDGNYSIDKNPIHIFSQEGNYLVNLRVTGPYGSDTASAVIDICETPTAGFSYELSKWGHLALINQSLKADTYLWDFGDGNFSDAETPDHIYGEDGTYSLILIVYRGSCSDTMSSMVEVCIFPKADFYYEQNGYEFTFYDTSTNADSLYWDFGDGFGSFQANPVYTFPGNGEYAVVLHAYNGCGEDSLTHMVSLPVEDINKPEDIIVFPVPASDRLFIKTDLPLQVVEAYIYGYSGQCISSVNVEIYNDGQAILDVSDITEGIYILKVFMNKQLIVRKVVIRR